jgi:hypothetical protein
MRRRLDESKALNQLITLASNSLSAQRGLMPVIGIGIMFFGLILLLIQLFVGAPTAKLVIEFFGILLQGLGILLSLIGFLLMEPLGK